MFNLDKIFQGDRGEIKTCKRCYYTGKILYVEEYPMDSIIKHEKVTIGTCEKCGSKVFIKYI
jgi:DNA-directed RNA polymerase subunit RPC12/RpoP